MTQLMNSSCKDELTHLQQLFAEVMFLIEKVCFKEKSTSSATVSLIVNQLLFFSFDNCEILSAIHSIFSSFIMFEAIYLFIFYLFH